MLNDINQSSLFCDYYKQWVEVYKKGAIRDATMSKYLMTHKWVERLAPQLRVSELTRTAYQQLLNDYASEHERQTTLDFHHQLKGAILDAVDEGYIERDPTRKDIIKGKTPRAKKIKYLNQFELHTLIADLDLGGPVGKALIERHDLLKTVVPEDDSLLVEDEIKHERHASMYPAATFQIIIAMGIGTIVSKLLSLTGMTFPVYIGAMIAAACIRNIGEYSGSYVVHMN